MIRDTRRYIFILVAFVFALHSLFKITEHNYSDLSFDSLSSRLSAQFKINSSITSNVENSTLVSLGSMSELPTNVTLAPKKPKSCLLMLARNSDLAGAISSVQSLEDRFNRKYKYPWIFLNDEQFSDEFIEHISILTDAPVYFGVIPHSNWVQPDWIDENKAYMGRLNMLWQGIIYATSVPYRNMCRFNSGFFYKHELLQDYDYYWRVEPDVKFFCDIDYDPFVYMAENNKVYSFTISLYELEGTIPTLWDAVKEFIMDYPQYVHPNHSMSFISDDGGASYNLCHYWSNFEIASLSFWRSEAYTKFFEHLESKGGFYYERWGDAPVHSIAASLFADKEQVHFFNDIGYKHESLQHCPAKRDWARGRCACDQSDTFDYHEHSCLTRFQNLYATEENQKPVWDAPEEYDSEFSEEGYYEIDNTEKEHDEVEEATEKGNGKLSGGRLDAADDDGEDEENEDEDDDDE